MDSCLPESLSPVRRNAETELIRGREFTHQLQKSVGDEISSSTQDLLQKILNSFTNTISMLRSNDRDEGSQIPVSSCVNSQWMSEDSGESCRSSAFKDQRGCSKRRKTSHTWVEESSIMINDGYAWRKYGQKVILNAQFPRSYFRCTHKMDQGCQASKHVQRIEADPPKYRTTYSGHHTCNSLFESPEIILDSNPSDSSVLFSFDGSICNEDRSPFFSSSPSVKQEIKEDTLSDVGYNYSSSSDYLLSPDLSGFDFSDQFPSVLTPTLQYNGGDNVWGYGEFPRL